MNPLLHYLQHGANEGRNPNPLFDSDWYLEQNSDIRAAGANPLVHYLRHGASEGRAPGPRFDGDRYLEEYPDVRAAGMNPLAHYLRHGAAEGKQARLLSDRDKYTYQKWVEAYDTLSADDIAKLRRLSASLAKRPLISVVMPVYNTELRWLRAAIESVRSQLYPDWQLCISDDASTCPGVREELRKYAEIDDRIKVFFRQDNGHISANSNSALTLAQGEYIALLDSDDILPNHALYCIAEEINAHPEADLIFSDEDKINEQGRRFEPYFKPDWNEALMLSQNAFSHLGVYRRSLVEQVGGFRVGFEGSQDHDLLLRCAEPHLSGAHPAYSARALSLARDRGLNRGKRQRQAIRLGRGGPRDRGTSRPQGDRRQSQPRRWRLLPSQLSTGAGDSQSQYFDAFGVPPRAVAAVHDGTARAQHVSKFRSLARGQ